MLKFSVFVLCLAFCHGELVDELSEKRQLAGGISDEVPNPQDYADIAWRAVTMSNVALTEVSVLSVRTQVVAGTRYIMKIQARDSQKTRTCDVEVWSRPWLDRDDSFIVQKFDCDKDDEKRQLAGGISDEVPNPQDYADIAWRAVTMSNVALTEVSVLSVRTQVVAGTRYIMKIQARDSQKTRTCEVEVWSRPWLDRDDSFIVQKFDCDKDDEKRQLAGGISQEKPNPQDYADIAWRAVTMSNVALTEVSVLSVRTQVVAGTRYIMKIQARDSQKIRTCDVEVWSRPWLDRDDSFIVQKFDCDKDDERRQLGKLVGGVSGPKANPQDYADIALRAVTMSNAALTEVSVLSVRTQVVAGIRYIMKIQAKDGQEIRTCDVEVLSQPWMDADASFRVLKFDCDKDNDEMEHNSERRQLLETKPILGGIQEMDNSQDYLDVALRAVELSNNALSEVKVKSARRQTVSGSMYYLNIEAKEGQQMRICDIQVWSRPWLEDEDGFKVIKFDCNN